MATSESQYQVNSGFFLEIIVRESSIVFQLFSSEDQSLLVNWDSFLIHNLLLKRFNSVWGFNFDSHSLSSEGLDEDLHASPESENEVESWFFLDVVIRDHSSIFKSLSSKDESLCVSGDAFLVLDLLFDYANGVSWF